MQTRLIGAGVLALAILPGTALAAHGDDILKAQCMECHATVKPADTSLNHIWTRKGPDLYYAGSKFNKAWLVQWLQSPTQIRPAGAFYYHHIKDNHGQPDTVDTASLKPHMKLSKADAEAVADALMALKAPADVVIPGSFKHQPVNATLGAMFFNKLRGCAACHSAAKGEGGFSGPELANAGARLQGDYIYSYIKNPQKIDPHVWMPNLGLNEADLQRLTGYLVSLGGKK